MSTVFTYNQNLAVKAGQAGFISETGAYVGRIIKALWILILPTNFWVISALLLIQQNKPSLK